MPCIVLNCFEPAIDGSLMCTAHDPLLTPEERAEMDAVKDMELSERQGVVHTLGRRIMHRAHVGG